MRYLRPIINTILFVGFTAGLAACGGGGGGGGGGGDGTTPTPITSFELLDPTPGAGDEFGARVAILANGNIVVSDPGDSSIASSSGAVHLYNPLTQTLIASIYGDTANDRLGSSSITVLANNNFVIASEVDDVGGIVNAGSVRLVNGATGAQIGSTIAGDTASDRLGESSITASDRASSPAFSTIRPESASPPRSRPGSVPSRSRPSGQ